MSYQVLARKWRPRSFAEMVGQEHVLRALINALDHDRLHHAYLFTGTRGVGKTTVARIFAKALNCEQGVSSTPCNACSACMEIGEGRFVDLIEVDAASRTKVEDTRELLDNVQYAPTRGRYKVYLIDEVHMLSKNSFNALLKTLEEPPPHIKFLLATTDPQRLPVTILSRCLQFNLKHLPQGLIAEHLGKILAQEGIESDEPALSALARAADGSIRDGLSLLDQAIAFGGGRVTLHAVHGMLGSIEQRYVYDILAALVDNDAQGLLAVVDQVAEHTYDFAMLLEDVMSALHDIALAQLLPDAVSEVTVEEHDAIKALAQRMGREDVQLYYQIALLGRRDLALAPRARTGIEMVLMRMLAFCPSAEVASAAVAAGTSARAVEVAEPPTREATSNDLRSGATPERAWEDVVETLGLSGVARALAVNCTLDRRTKDVVRLSLDDAHAHLRSASAEVRLEQALGRYYAAPVKLEIVVGTPRSQTPARQLEEREQNRLQAAIEAIEGDAEFKKLQETFNARIIPDTIQPVD
jgi:DNA polymerase-3 subunit gamma/tau